MPAIQRQEESRLSKIKTDPLFPLAEFPTSDHRLVYVDVSVNPANEPIGVDTIEFLGEVQFETGTEVLGTELGGLSGLTYDAARDVYYALSDDRSSDTRFYTTTIDLSDGRLDEGDVAFTDVTTLLDTDGERFPDGGLDPEGIALSSDGTLYVSSEGDANQLIDPFIRQMSLTGAFIDELEVPSQYRPTADQSSGIRNNLAFESLTITPNQQALYTATEGALFQDGPGASVDEGSLARILQYDLTTGEPVAEFIYPVAAVPEEPIPADAFNTNGLVELLAVNNDGTLLALERAFSVGQGNTVKLFEIETEGASNILGQDNLSAADIENASVTKRELLDVETDLGIAPDNLEALALGPVLDDGRQSLIIASDNNFNPNGQFTQFLAFALEFDTGVIAGTAGDDVLKGTDEGDRIEAGAGNDTLLGLKGDDYLLGGAGGDRMLGDSGDDIFDGGVGDDRYIGGKGADSFILRPGEGVDAIRDFRLWQGDTIVLASGLTFDDLTIDRFGQDGAELFVGDELLATVQSIRFGAINTESAFTTL